MTVQEAIQEVVRSNVSKYSDAPLEALFRENIFHGLVLMCDSDPIQRLACQMACIGFYAGRLYERHRDPRVGCTHANQHLEGSLGYFCDACNVPCT